MASLSAPSSDPTNANAIAGPSRANVPAAPTANGAARAMPTAAPPAPAPTPAPPAARTQAPPPKRSANGPLIVKTLVSSVDGVREVPSAFEHCEVDDLIVLISSMLDRLIQHNDRIPLSPDSLTRFHSRAPPNISVRDYLVRIARFTNVEPCCLLMLLPYVDKVCARLPTFTISSLTVHRFIIAAISVGSKALSDAFCTNGRYSRVGGVSIVEMNLLEKEFCEALDWRLTTSGPVLAHYYTSLVTSHPQYRVSSAPLPTPPPPPPVDVPPPFPPPPRGERAPLAPVAFAAGGGGGATGAGPMDVDPPAPASQPPASVAPQAHNPSASLNSSLSASIASSASASSSSLSVSTTSSAVSPSSSSASPAIHARSPSSPDERGRPRGREREHFSSSSAAAPSPVPPPLIPPNLARLNSSGTASHLPSPHRPAYAGAPPSAGGSGGAGSGAGAAGGLASPAKRVRHSPSSSSPSWTEGAATASAGPADRRAENGEAGRIGKSPRLEYAASARGGSLAVGSGGLVDGVGARLAVEGGMGGVD